MRSAIVRYVSLVSFAAVCLGAVLYFRHPAYSVEFARAAFTFGLVSILAQVLSYRTGRESSASLAFIPVLATAAIAPHWVSVLAVGAAGLSAQLLAKRDRLKTIFNVAQECLAITLAILAYQWFGGVPLRGIEESSSLSLFVLFLVFFATNSICVSGALGIVGERSAWVIWKEITLKALPYDFLSLPVILFFVWTYSQYGTVGAFVFAVPLLVLRQLYKVTGQLEQTNRELLELMVAAIEARDPYTSGHSRRVAEKARVIAGAMGLRDREIGRIVAAALLHDVGKIHEVFGPILSNRVGSLRRSRLSCARIQSRVPSSLAR